MSLSSAERRFDKHEQPGLFWMILNIFHVALRVEPKRATQFLVTSLVPDELLAPLVLTLVLAFATNGIAHLFTILVFILVSEILLILYLPFWR